MSATRRRKRKPDVVREARRAWLERMIQRAPLACVRTWAARELGKLWAEEALEEIREALA